jgi:hypothetical protein
MTLEQIVNTHPCPIIRGKIMENVATITLPEKIGKNIIDIIDYFGWDKSKEGYDFWNTVFESIYYNKIATYSDLKHLDLSYVPVQALQPVMWRKIDANDIPTDVVLCTNEDKSKIVINRIGVNALDGKIQSNNRREFFEVNYYIPLSDLINLPIQP